MNNSLTITDTRSESLNDDEWTVMGRIFENDDDMDGTDVHEGFDSISGALAFIRATLFTV